MDSMGRTGWMVWFFCPFGFRNGGWDWESQRCGFGYCWEDVFISRVLDGCDGNEILMISPDDIFTELERYQVSGLIIM